MVQKVPFTSTSGNTMTLGTGTSRVVMGADSGNLKIQDSQSNTSIIEAGAGIVGASAITTYANSSIFPINPISASGTLAYATLTNSLYISNGSGWYKISTLNTSPSITLSSTSADPTTENLTLDFTYTVNEPEGTPTTVTFANSGIATTGNVAITHTTSNNHLRMVFDGTTPLAGATVTLTVTDGVNTGTGTITISTAYSLKNSKYEALTLLANNPPGITTIKQQSLLHTTSYDTLSATHDDLAPGSGDFTVECWFKPTAVTANQLIYDTAQAGASGSVAGRIALFLNGNPNKMAVYQPGVGITTASSGSLSAGTWYHLAWVRNSGTLKMYLDGTEVGSYSTTYNFSRGSLTIGRDRASGGTSPLNGRLSNLRMVKGTAVYTSAFTPPTAPLTAITNTNLLIAQGSDTDNSADNRSFTTSGSPTYDADSPFAPAGTLYTNKFVRDTSNSAHTVEMFGTAAQSHTSQFSPYASGGYSTYFDGSGDYLRDDTLADINDSGGKCDNFTLEFWAYSFSDPASNTDHIIGCNNLSGGLNDFVVGIRRANWDNTQIGSDYGGIYTKQNQWHHYVFMHETDGSSDADIVTLWIDGHRVFRVTGLDRISFDNNSFAFGTEADGSNFGSLGNYFEGYLHDVKFTKAKLYTSTNETISVPGSRSTAHASLNIFHGFHNPFLDPRFTIGGTPFPVPYIPYDREVYAPDKHGGSFYINNNAAGNIETTDKATNEIQLGTGNFTIELWYRPEGATSFWEAILSKRYATTGGWRLYKDTSNGYLKWYRSSTNSLTTSTSVLRDKVWTHIAIVRNSGTMKIYCDGVEKGSASDTYDYTTTTAGEIEFGGGSVTSELPAEGFLSDLRIVVGTAVYTGAFTPPTRPLTKTGGTYPSTTNVNTSFDASHTKLLLNLGDVLVGDASQQQSLEMEGNVTSSLGKSKFADQPSIYFDGNGDYLSQNIQPSGDTDTLKIGTEDFTVEGYVYALSVSTDSQYRRIFAYGDNGTDSIQVYIHSSGGKLVYTADDGSSLKISGTSNIQDVWKHFVVRRVSGQVRLYVDGVQEGSAITDANSKTQAAGAFLIGKYPGYSGHFHGYLENLRVLKGKSVYPYYADPVTLTPTNSGMTKPDGTTPTPTASNVTLLTCHAGTAGSATVTDGSSNGTSISVSGNAVVSNFAPAPGMKSVKFDGSGDFLQCTLADTIGTNDWTIEYWVYHNNTSGNQIHCAFNGYAPAFYYRNGSNAFTVYHNGGIASPYYNTNITPEANRWYHMAYVHDDSEGKLTVFQDGGEIDHYSYSGNISGTTFRIGDDGTSSWMDGYISNLRIIKNTALYTRDFTPPVRFK